MGYQFVRKQHLTSDIWTFYFYNENPRKYNAGQFIEMSLPHSNPDDRGTKRWFTLSSSPNDVDMTITTRIVKDEPSTFKQTLSALQSGHPVAISDPMGDFTLPKDKEIPLVFVAGGIGITPFHSMARWSQQQDESRTMKLLYAAKSDQDFIFLDELESCGLSPVLLSDKPLDASAILNISNTFANGHIYLSGPEPMVEAISKQLQPRIRTGQQVITDSFPGYSVI